MHVSDGAIVRGRRGKPNPGRPFAAGIAGGCESLHSVSEAASLAWS